MGDKIAAFKMAQDAARLDFRSALDGLLAGHIDCVDEMQRELNKKNSALLASLALGKKGARIGADDGLAKIVIDALPDSGASICEREFKEKGGF